MDQYDWGKQIAEWFVQEIGGKGDIVVLAGVAGGPSNVSRLEGQYDVLEQYPDINVLTEVNGDWDQGTAQTVMSNVIASYPNIDGVLTQDGMSLGTIKAFQAAGRDIPVVSGETMVGFLRLWKELEESEGFNTWGINDPPSVSTAALSIGIRLLQGKTPKEGTLDGNYFYYPVQVIIDNDNLDEYLEEYKDAEDTYFPDERLSEEEIDSYFE
jgi:ribose transport system substrate-binding protein